MNTQGTSLLSVLEHKINQDQMQTRFDMIIAPELFRMDVTSERDIEIIYDPIICNRTSCRYKIKPTEISLDTERCK